MLSLEFAVSHQANPEPSDPSKKKGGRKLATFRRHQSRKLLKKKLRKTVKANVKALKEMKKKEKKRALEREAASESREENGSDVYQGYSLKHLPLETRPQDRKNTGKHSYTLKSAVGRGTIEVLLRHHAFFVKILDEGACGPKGQISWKKHTPDQAWDLAKQRSGYVVPRA